MTNTEISAELTHLLRNATKLAHHAIDHHPLLAPLVRADLTLSQYGDALEALHGVQAQLEANILAYLEQHPGLFDYQLHLRLGALESDLAALGRSPHQIKTDFPAPQSIGALVAMLYVVEGSSKGGQVIARMMREHALEKLPMNYFSGNGDFSQHRWDKFLQFAKKCCDESEYPIAIATAESLFDGIKSHLDSYHACLNSVSAPQ